MTATASTYKPPLLHRNGHVHTIIPALFRKVSFSYHQRQRLELADGDFLDVDWRVQNSSRAMILCHGLEGSSNSSYVLGMARHFFREGYDVIAWNHRSCSGEMNRLPRFYHHAVVDDLAAVIHACAEYYQAINLVGFSLGGNLILKYLGNRPGEVHSKIKSAVSFSAPVDLHSCVREIHRPINRVYAQRFLKSVKEKVRQKQQTMPSLRLKPLREITSLRAFDDAYTAPIHGFKDGKDYYSRASSKDDLKNITVPTLLINAWDDPMLGPECFPGYEFIGDGKLRTLYTKYGGHCGFVATRNSYWSEQQALHFINGEKETHE